MSGIFPLTLGDWVFIGLVMEGFFYGIYSAIFAMYLQHQTSNKCPDKKKTIVFYPICILYILTVALVAMDILRVLALELADYSLVYPTIVVSSVINGCCDFIGQSILIYRCWIVWNRNIRVVIVPTSLTFAFLVLWLVYSGSAIYENPQHQFRQFEWGKFLTFTSIVMSLAVNALVTGLIVFKIFKVYCEVKPLYGHAFGATGGSKLRPVIFVLIESGMALFCIQLARLVVTFVWTQPAVKAAQPIIYIHQMFYGITPTIIQVRVAMGLSFHDEKSMVEVTSTLRFGADHPNAIPERGNGMSIHHQGFGNDDQDCKDNDDDQRNDKSGIVEVYGEQHISPP